MNLGITLIFIILFIYINYITKDGILNKTENEKKIRNLTRSTFPNPTSDRNCVIYKKPVSIIEDICCSPECYVEYNLLINPDFAKPRFDKMETYQSIDDLCKVIDDVVLADLVLDYYKDIVKAQEFPKKRTASIKPENDTVKSKSIPFNKLPRVFINWRFSDITEQDLLNVLQKTTAPIELLEKLQKKRFHLTITTSEFNEILHNEKNSILKYKIGFNELSLSVTNNWNKTKLIL